MDNENILNYYKYPEESQFRMVIDLQNGKVFGGTCIGCNMLESTCSIYLNFRPEYMSGQSNVPGVSLRRNLQSFLVHFLPYWNRKEITFPSSQRILLIVHCFLQAY